MTIANWIKNNKLLLRQYKKQNYIVKNTNKNSDLCIIFFSGNGLYFPNTEEEFNKTIVQNNRYEWEHITSDYTFLKKTGKLIFVRDIYKQWYFNGINTELNTIEKTAQQLKQETRGYQIITVGNSAGGFAAVIFGILLNAEKIFSFSGQFDLYSEIKTNPFLLKAKQSKDKNRYFNITNYVTKHKIPVYYFYPYHNKEDLKQAENISNVSSVFSFKINRILHGDTITPNTYKYLFFLSEKKLQKLYIKFKNILIEPDIFLIACSSMYKIYFTIKRIIGLVFSKKLITFLKGLTV
ncbi:hypothetical protein [Treponema lecithinolyticum]